MRPMRERLETAAQLWLQSGRRADLLLAGKAFFAAQCWLYTGENFSLSAKICDLVAASKAALGGESGWNALLNEKEFCADCGTSYHMENMRICTGCMQYTCVRCHSRHTRCGGEVVG